MVRLSGKSVLYLPQEYSPCSLILPTCIRATAQYIAQNATTRGIFRIPGSVKIVNSLFDYYCYMSNDSLDVAGTVCCATLPTHIQYSVHDVGSTFKRLLSVLPGGILGSLSLFDAFVGIHSQLHGEPEFPRTKQTKVRARLIALAIGTIESQFRRELLCAVFGLLSLIGRVAEMSPREDADGRPLPTGDLIGYNALGIVFGPLLVGDLLDKYTMKLVTPTSGLLLFPLSPKRHRRDKQKHKSEGNDPPPVDKVMVAINIAEMLIINWRDMVRQMKALGTHYHHESSSMRLRHGHRHPSTSESFTIKMPPELREPKQTAHQDLYDREHSPEPETPTMALNRRRSRPMKRAASTSRFQKHYHVHTNTEASEEDHETHRHGRNGGQKQVFFAHGKGKEVTQGDGVLVGSPPVTPIELAEYEYNDTGNNHGYAQDDLRAQNHANPHIQSPNLALGRVPPRVSSKQGLVRNRSATSSTTISSPSHEFTKLPSNEEALYQTREQDERNEQRIDLNFPTSRTAAQLARSEKDPGGSTALTNSGDSAHSPEQYLPQDQRKPVDDYKGTNLKSFASLNLSVDTGDFQGLPFFKPERELTGTRSEPVLTHTPGSAVGGESFYNHMQATYQSHHDDVEGFEQDRDTSEKNSLRSTESDMLMKRRSVKAMAAMFESQQILQHMAHSSRHPPAGGVYLTPLGKGTRDFLERSNSLPLWAPRNSDKSAWIGNKEYDLDKSPTGVDHLKPNPQMAARSHDSDECARINTCATTCSRNKSMLKLQIENLERLLNNKVAEVEKLTRWLESQGNGSSPNEQLRQAKKDASIWKEKAEAAERKMKVFEKFTTRVRGIRDSMLAGSSRQSSINQGLEPASETEAIYGDQGASPQQIQRVRFAEILKMASEMSASDDSGTMGDEVVVPAKVRNCLHRDADKREEPLVSGDVFGTDGTMSPREGGKRNSGPGVVQMWSAVEELLQMEDDEMFRGGWSPGTKQGFLAKAESGLTIEGALSRSE